MSSHKWSRRSISTQSLQKPTRTGSAGTAVVSLPSPCGPSTVQQMECKLTQRNHKAQKTKLMHCSHSILAKKDSKSLQQHRYRPTAREHAVPEVTTHLCASTKCSAAVVILRHPCSLHKPLQGTTLMHMATVMCFVTALWMSAKGCAPCSFAALRARGSE